MEYINNAIKWIEENPIIGAFILTSLSGTVINFSNFIKSSLKKSAELNNIFWSKNGYQISAVLVFYPIDAPEGYRQEQFSRPDLWNKYIIEKSSFFNLRHSIKPKNKELIMHVSLRIKGSPTSHYISFNR